MKKITRNEMLKKHLKKRRIVKIFVVSLLFFVSVLGLVSYFYSSYHIKQIQKEKQEQIEKIKKETIALISSNYSSTVMTVKDTAIYSLTNGEYIEVGSIKQGVSLNLGELDIDENTYFFPITNFQNTYYVAYPDVTVSNSEVEKTEKRYQNYIAFDKNVITKSTKLYKDGELIYDLPESMAFPIYIMDNDKYYVEYNADLYYVLKDENVDSIVDSENSEEEKAKEIGTILYHFVYDPSTQKCNEIICQTISQVQSHIDYLKSKNYFTLTMDEFEKFIDGKINLPKNSILITLDDGMYADNAKKLFTDNKMNITFFIVSSWFDPMSFVTDYVEVHSHTNNLHRTGICPNTPQGGPLTCMNKAKLLEDLKISREKTNMTTVISYPFYEYNNYAISVLKEAGFTMGFAGYKAGGSLKAFVNYDKFRIPRITILNDTTVEDLAEIF